jgi:predicted RNA binding protein YcfA (HicA-like mRNA interferase family)
MTMRAVRTSGKDMVRALKRAGFEVVAIAGSHHSLRHPTRGRKVTVPVHGKEILTPKTLRSILDPAGMNESELRRLL